jgi:hypothetical protein
MLPRLPLKCLILLHISLSVVSLATEEYVFFYGKGNENHEVDRVSCCAQKAHQHTGNSVQSDHHLYPSLSYLYVGDG